MKKSIPFLFVTLLVVQFSIAQPASVLYSVHEDIVKPSMDAKYREAIKKLKAACEQHKLNFTWGTVAFDDGSYRHLAPIKSFADLDKNPFAELEAKMGKVALGKIWAEFDECLESQSDFVMMLLPHYSYLAPGAEENYRDIMYWYPLPGKNAEAESILAEWKKLYESKKSVEGYLVYKVMFGREPVYSIVAFGKDGVDADTKAQKAREQLGAEVGPLWRKMLGITKRYYSKRANVSPEFSYVPAK
jgi:hypothetical protein